MPRHEHIHDKEDMVKFTKDYLVDEIHRLQRKCQHYEKRLEYIWNDPTIFNLQKRIEEYERKELKAKLQIASIDSPIITILRETKRKGITYRTIAKKMKVTTPTLSRWVNGIEAIPIKRQRQITKLFGQTSV